MRQLLFAKRHVAAGGAPVKAIIAFANMKERLEERTSFFQKSDRFLLSQNPLINVRNIA